MFDLILIRVLFVAIMGLAAFYLRPLGLPGLAEVAIGLAAGGAVVVFEFRIKQVSLKRLIGAGFAPLVALGLSAYFGLAYVSLYLLSGAAGTLAALWINRKLEDRD